MKARIKYGDKILVDGKEKIFVRPANRFKNDDAFYYTSENYHSQLCPKGLSTLQIINPLNF